MVKALNRRTRKMYRSSRDPRRPHPKPPAKATPHTCQLSDRFSLDENRLAVVAKQHGIKKAKDGDSIENCLPSSPCLAWV